MADLLPLTVRLGVLGWTRAALAVVALLAPLVLGDTGTGRTTQPQAAIAACGLLAGAALFEAARRALGGLPGWLVGVSLLVDAVWLAAATVFTGGPTGPLGLLAPVHLVAVTLLASYRTGLKLAMWYSLLLAVAGDAQAAGWLPGDAASRATTAGAILMFWLAALFTAACSAYNERELRRGRAGFRALAEMGARLESAAEPGDVLDGLLAAVGEHTGFARTAVLSRRGDTTEGRSWPDGGVLVVPTAPLPPAGGAVGRCWRGRAPVLAATLEAEADGPLAELLPGARNVIVLPLATEDGTFGVLAVERGGRARARVPASLVDLLGEFAAHAALAHRNATLVEQMRRMAAVDGLTGLANRRAFDSALRAEVERSARTGQPLSLVLLDVDHFKRINDTFGHQAGDDVLRNVGAVLAAGRATDLAARYGGEEFAVLLPACSSADAVAVAERLRAGIAAVGPPEVTASAGVATLQARPGTKADQGSALVDAADSALYQAKRAGRDRTVRSGALLTAGRPPRPAAASR